LFVTSEGQIPWAPARPFYVGQYVIDPTGHKQRVITAGTSQTPGPPTWNDGGGTTTDNTVTWQDDGTFTGTLERGMTLRDSFGCAAPYEWWNVAYNAEVTFIEGMGGATVVAELSTQSPIIQTGFTADLPSTVVYSVVGGEVQRLNVSYYISLTTAGAGTLTPTLAWTDPFGHAQTQAFTGLNLAGATGSFVSGVVSIVAGSGVNVTISTTGYGSGTYAAYVKAREN